MSYDYRKLDDAWDDLPKVPIRGLKARWLGPLVDDGLAEWISDLSSGAYGIIESCGWLDVVQDLPPMCDEDGKVQKAWRAGMREASRKLADAGSYSGPESSEERWLSWLVWELSEPHRWVRGRLEG